MTDVRKLAKLKPHDRAGQAFEKLRLQASPDGVLPGTLAGEIREAFPGIDEKLVNSIAAYLKTHFRVESIVKEGTGLPAWRLRLSQEPTSPVVNATVVKSSSLNEENLAGETDLATYTQRLADRAAAADMQAEEQARKARIYAVAATVVGNLSSPADLDALIEALLEIKSTS